MILNLIKFSLLFLTTLPAIQGNEVHEPILVMELSPSGYHRDLIYTAHFDYPLAALNCEYALEQHFPAGAYVSVDQLNDLKRMNKLNAIHPEFVDIEASAENAEPFTVIVTGVPKISDTIKLPIHFRYHAPNSEKTHAEVKLSTPLMYIKCIENDNDAIEAELLETPHIKHCLEMDKPIFATHAEETSRYLDCNWRALKVNYQIKNSLIAEIPVGNSNGLPLVLYATIICSWVISLWTVFRTRNVPRSINKKLEEQRIINKRNQ